MERDLSKGIPKGMSDEETTVFLLECPADKAVLFLKRLPRRNQTDVLNLIWKKWGDQGRAVIEAWGAREKKFPKIQELNETQFEKQVLESTKPVMIYFNGNWCRPCFKLKPVVEEMARQLQEKVSFFEMDMGKLSDDFIHRYDIQGVPSFFLFDGGKLVGKTQGYPAGKKPAHELWTATREEKKEYRERITALLQHLFPEFK